MEVLVGVDWGHERSRVIAESASGAKLLDEWVETDTLKLRSLALRLEKLADGGIVKVMVETKAGPVVTTMVRASFEVIAVNPKKVDRAREMFSASGAKDDLRDARVMLWMLRACPEVGVALSRRDPLLDTLRMAGRRHLDITEKRVVVRNQLRELCRTYFPKLLRLTKNLDANWVALLLIRAPTPAKLRKMGLSRLSKFLKQHRVRSFQAADLLEVVGSAATDLHAPGAMVEMATMEVSMLAGQLQLLNAQQNVLRRELDSLLDGYHAQLADSQGEVTDVAILKSMPGIGRCVAATFLGEGLVPLLTGSFEAARSYSGVAPVTSATGMRQKRKKGFVTMRRACNVHIRRACHIMADKAPQKDARIKKRYAAYRAKGHSHGRACRQLADRQLAVIRALLRDRQLYRKETQVIENIDQ